MKYRYKAKKNPTIVVDGHVEADNEDQALHLIHEMGLAPIEVDKDPNPSTPLDRSRPREHTERDARATPPPGPFAPPGRGQRRSPRTPSRVRAAALNKFTRQLSTLVKTHVPILRALSLIAEQPGDKRLNQIALSLADAVREGKTLTQAMAQYPGVFDTMYRNMVMVGEQGGILAQTLERLAEYREQEMETRRNLEAALAYPAFVMLVGMLTVFGVITFILPKIVDIFREAEGRLPLPTRLLIATSDFMAANWYWIVLILLLVIAVIGRSRPGSRRELVLDFIKIHIPGIRGLVRNAEIARFSRTLSLLVHSGVSIHEGLMLAAGSVSNAALRRRMTGVADRIVTQGATLSGSLGQSGIFPKFAVNMISVGEESGDLRLALEELAETYEREVAHAVRLIVALLEPLFILIVGGIVAFIVFALLLPIFNIGGLQ